MGESEKYRQKSLHNDIIVRTRYSPSGRYLISADKSGQITLWSAVHAHGPKRFASSGILLTDVWFSEDEKTLFVGHQDGFLRIFNIPNVKLTGELYLKPNRSDTTAILSGTSRPVLNYVVLTVCPIDSPNIYVFLEYRDIFILSRDTLQVTGTIHSDGNIVEQTAASLNGKKIFFGDDIGYIYRFSLPEMKLTTFAQHSEMVNGFNASAIGTTKINASTGIAALAVSYDGRFLASTSYTGGAQIWDTTAENAQSGNIRDFAPIAAKEPNQEGRMRGVGFYPDSSCVVTGCDDGTLEVWDINSHKVTHQMNFPEGIRSIDVSPDNSTMAIGCKDGSIFFVPMPGTCKQGQDKIKSNWLQRLFLRT